MRVATDIGGTFTDLTYLDEETGELGFAKVSTTPGRLEQGILAALGESGVAASTIVQFVHGTTVVINAITERNGAKVGLLTTRGMRDVLEIARGNRPDIYNLLYQKPKPFVPRHLRFDIRERMDAHGEVVEPLAAADVRRAAAYFRQEGVTAVAVCFLHAYANPAHEQRAGEIIRELLPDAYLTLSHQITREFREYERSSTAVLNSYIGPLTSRYLTVIEDSLIGIGINANVHIMQSNGGSATVAAARAAPINLVESGPVGGVIGAAALGRLMGTPNLITLDIGGTTAKTSLIAGGEVTITTDHKLEWTPRRAGYPVKVPVIDIVEIGAGGGSIARLDETGALRVGPQSAGAEPGPVSYDRGGTRPTVTDANLVAGRYDAARFLGGKMPLSREKARASFDPLACHFGLSPEATALGVIRLVNANMMNALNIVSVQRGHDPRDFALLAMGGGGPVHGAYLARELQIGRMIVPVAPGHFSAHGMLTTDLRRDAIQTYVRRTDTVDLGQLTGQFAAMERDALDAYRREGFDPTLLRGVRAADMRYRGQEHTVSVPVMGGALTDMGLREVERRFHAAHEQKYTFRLTSAIELVNLHVTVFGQVQKPRRAPLASQQGAVKPTRQRIVDFDDQGRQDTAIYDRAHLGAGARIAGPAIIEEVASTTVVYPGMTVDVDRWGNLIVDTGLGAKG
ncbi:MAG: hydantoinase/oxoprolinase family protein [Chloroflexota bacterium]|nr:hydantoinase/oxoprolinase family protein [Chloroflexota bacterium]